MDNSLFDMDLLLDVTEGRKATQYVKEIDIYKHYTSKIGGYPPIDSEGTKRNPFKIETKSPSFSIYDRNNRVSWKDHSSGEKGDVFKFVEKWYKVFKNVIFKNFGDLNKQILSDLQIDDSKEKLPQEERLYQLNEETHSTKSKKRYLIQVVDTGWTNWAYRYWSDRYLISANLLDAYNVGHAKEVWITPPNKPTYLWGISTPDNPIYYFYFPKSKHVKCYRPLAKSKKDKWIMNCDNNVDIQGYDQLNIKITKPKLIIFTKALKEILFYRSLGLYAIAIHGENHHFNPDFIRHIKKYSKHQLCLYDSDWPGKKATARLRMKYGNEIDYFFIKEAKNVTDLWEKNPKLVLEYVNQIKTKYGI